MALRRILQERRLTALSCGGSVLVAAVALAAPARRSPPQSHTPAESSHTTAPDRSIALLPTPQGVERVEFHDAGKTVVAPQAQPRPKRVRRPAPPVQVPDAGTSASNEQLIDQSAGAEATPAAADVAVTTAPEHQHESPAVTAAAVANTYVPGSVGSAKRRWAGFVDEPAEPNDGPVTGFVTPSRKHCPPRGRYWMPAVHFHD
jgi:hypothetical protein